MRKIKNQSSNLVAEFTHNGLNHRTEVHYDVDGDGDYDSADPPFLFTSAGYAITHANYTVDFDLDRDGDVDATDLTIGGTTYPTPLTRGELSYSAVGNIVGYDGYLFDREMEQYTVRHRHYDPVLGRWLERGIGGPSNPLRCCDRICESCKDFWKDVGGFDACVETCGRTIRQNPFLP